MAETLVEFDKVTLRVNGANCFAGTTWVIREGEHWGIVGPNGAGKSILAAALAGRVQVIAGKLTYPFATGTSILDQQRSLNEAIQFVSSDAQQQLLGGGDSFYQARWQSLATENAPSVSDLLSIERIADANPFVINRNPPDPTAFAKRRAEMVELLELTPLLERKVLFLSNGESRKLILASALLKQPKLLILDDPFAGLDVDYRRHLAEILPRLMAHTTLLVLGRSREELPSGLTHLLQVENRQVIDQGPISRSTGVSQSLRSIRMIQEFPSPPETSDPLIELHDVIVRYGQSVILDRLSWTINRGDAWALIGPNGSGKTTLIGLIAGDHPQAYANRITLFGRRRGSGESIWDIKQHIGWLSPELQVHYPGDYSAFEVVCSGFHDTIGLFKPLTGPQVGSFHEWWRRLELGDWQETPLGHLSTGQQRLVLLARALVKNPPLLILDEPCQGLDPAHRNHLVAVIDALARQPARTLIYTSHQDDIPPAVTLVKRLGP